MSTPVSYVPEAVTVQYLDGATWTALAAASIILNQSYDVSERGILVPGVDTAELSLSMWVDEPIEVPAQGTVVRLLYVQPGLDELYRGVVTDVSVSYAAAPAAARHGHAWRADFQVSTTSLAASRLAVTVSWTTLPAETVSARLGRWIDDVDLMSIDDPLMPAETSAGSTTLMEIVRSACDYLGRPVRLVNSGSATAIEVVTAGASLPAGYTEADALSMYSRASVQTSAGDRAVSFDADDETLAVSADLINDDVRVLFSSWRIPDPLPAPFNDAAPVQGFSMTFTPEGCSGSLTFSYDTPHKLRYRPPAPYVPGEPSTTVGNGGSTGSTGGSGGTGGGGSSTTTTVTTFCDNPYFGALAVPASTRWTFTAYAVITIPGTASGDLNLLLDGTDIYAAATFTATSLYDGDLSIGGPDLGTRALRYSAGDTSRQYAAVPFFATTSGADQHILVTVTGQVRSTTGGTFNLSYFTPGVFGANMTNDAGGAVFTKLDTAATP